MGTSACLVKVVPKAYASEDAMIADLNGRTSTIQNLINAGDPNAAINYISILLNIINSGAGGTQRRSLLVSNAEMASMKCGTLAPLLYSSLPTGGLIGFPSAASVSRNAIASLLQLLTVTAQINDQCLTEMQKIMNVVLKYVVQGSTTTWYLLEPDLILLQDLSDSISAGITGASDLYAVGSINGNTSKVRIATIMTHHENMAAARSYGSVQGEAAKSLDSTKMRCKIWRLTTPTTSTSTRSWHRTDMPETEEADDGELEERPGFAGSRRLLVTNNPGTTQIPAWSGSFTQSVFTLPAITLPFAINKVANVVGNNGITLSELPSVSATATHYVSFYNPHFYSSQASQVIAPVLSLQLQAFGMQEVVSITNLPPASQIVLDFQLKRVPSATRNSQGQHQVAACAYWDGNKWETRGCSLDKVVVADSGGQDVRAICKCTIIGQHTVLDLPAGCDGVPFSTLIWDECLVCGGDGSTCKGCDGVANSGAKYDGCQGRDNPKGVCGGDNSTCAGCDGIPKSGTVLDKCSVCGGDNSTCTGCDGLSVHPLVTARTGLRPKAFDSCMSQQNPHGVCGGCDASCRGCDGRVNSGKLYDKCGKCGDFTNVVDAANSGVGPNSWYSRSSIDNCTLGLKSCATGFVPDNCGTCIPFGSGPNVRNQACQSCDNRAGVFSYQYGNIQIGGKVADQCGVCGGNDCSCVDCKGVVGGKSLYDRCGVCQGNNTCLDCAGTPYGVKVPDVCGICGGNNHTRNCRGCDGRVYPLPSVPPQFDRDFVCCAVSLVGCNNTCFASVGCDGVCSKEAKSIDMCGICGGTNAPNTGTCDCAGIPNGLSRIGCDGQCRTPALVLDICGVCGGTNKSETGHCDCEGMPHGPAIRDSSGVCCYMSDMGCGSKNQSRCFSGKTWDICNTCGGDGGTCVQTRPSPALRVSARWDGMALAAALILALLVGCR